ncbi:hypothetical protein [uncultured Duncaniella sp.]|uniref:hypothetical protein n=1 Tax=uncultured Duncaniella sp. TaxID=2768039 RepID=UPI0026F3CAE7|nr:hypothetical protein [uncultured Duncaniella sp.]
MEKTRALTLLPPYMPHLNIAEALLLIFKGKWPIPADYISTDSMLYATTELWPDLYLNSISILPMQLNVN